MLGGRGRKPFIPLDTSPTFVRNMILSINMADWVDQTFVKVYFHRMTMEYSNWLVRNDRPQTEWPLVIEIN